MPLQLLTADEKVTELQQILEAKDLENDEMRVQMECNQNDQGSGSNDNRLANSQRNSQQMQEILWLVNSAANDINQNGHNPQLMADMLMQKLQSINNVANKMNQDFQTDSVNLGKLDQFQRPGSSQSGQTS